MPKFTRRAVLSAAIPATALAAGVTVEDVNSPADAAPLVASQPDRLLELVNAYRSGMAAFNAMDLEGKSNEEVAALADVTYQPAWDALEEECPDATTLEGALAALRMVEDDRFSFSELYSRLVAAALAVLAPVEPGSVAFTGPGRYQIAENGRRHEWRITRAPEGDKPGDPAYRLENQDIEEPARHMLTSEIGRVITKQYGVSA